MNVDDNDNNNDDDFVLQGSNAISNNFILLALKSSKPNVKDQVVEKN